MDPSTRNAFLYGTLRLNEMSLSQTEWIELLTYLVRLWTPHKKHMGGFRPLAQMVPLENLYGWHVPDSEYYQRHAEEWMKQNSVYTPSTVVNYGDLETDALIFPLAACELREETGKAGDVYFTQMRESKYLLWLRKGQFLVMHDHWKMVNRERTKTFVQFQTYDLNQLTPGSKLSELLLAHVHPRNPRFGMVAGHACRAIQDLGRAVHKERAKWLDSIGKCVKEGDEILSRLQFETIAPPPPPRSRR